MENISITVDDHKFKINIDRRTIKRITDKLTPHFHFDEITSDEPVRYWSELGQYPYKEALNKFKKLEAFI